MSFREEVFSENTVTTIKGFAETQGFIAVEIVV